MKKFILVSPKNRSAYNFRGDLIKDIQKKGYDVVVTGPNKEGIDRIKALGYNITLMNQEISNIISDQVIDIRSEILNMFSVGDKVSKNSVKDQLKKLYTSLGYSKTPKAVDLGDYFIIKNCKIPKPDGTRDNGYEILAIKE